MCKTNTSDEQGVGHIRVRMLHVGADVFECAWARPDKHVRSMNHETAAAKRLPRLKPMVPFACNVCTRVRGSGSVGSIDQSYARSLFCTNACACEHL